MLSTPFGLLLPLALFSAAESGLSQGSPVNESAHHHTLVTTGGRWQTVRFATLGNASVIDHSQL